jgi:hypothetical protein
MAAYDTKLKYPCDINAVELEHDYGDDLYIFKYLDTVLVGTLFARDDDELALGMRLINGTEHSIVCYVDIYPEMGVVTFAGSFNIKSNF